MPLNGVITLIVALLVMSDALQLWMLIIVLVLMAFLAAFHSAAFDTSYAMIVPEEKLPRANGMMQTIWALSGIISPAIAAAIIALPAIARQGALGPGLAGSLGALTDGTALAMMIDTVTFFIAAVVLVFLYIPSPVRTDLRSADGKTQKSIWSDVKQGGSLYSPAAAVVAARHFRRDKPAQRAGRRAGADAGEVQLCGGLGQRGFTFEAAVAMLSTVMALGGVVGGLAVTAWGGLKQRFAYTASWCR